MAERLDGAKLERRCPRCTGVRRGVYNHPAVLYRKDDGLRYVMVTCCHCGHRWRGRYRKDEWNRK